MAHQLRALAVLPEDPSSVPNTHIKKLTSAFLAPQPSWRLVLVGGCSAPKAGRWWLYWRRTSLRTRSTLGSNLLWKVGSTCWATNRLWRWSDKAKWSWLSLPTTAQEIWNSTMPWWLKLVSITTVAIILNWAQRVENTTEYVHWLSLTQVILILLEACQNRLVRSKQESFPLIKLCQSSFWKTWCLFAF